MAPLWFRNEKWVGGERSVDPAFNGVRNRDALKCRISGGNFIVSGVGRCLWLSMRCGSAEVAKILGVEFLRSRGPDRGYRRWLSISVLLARVRNAFCVDIRQETVGAADLGDGSMRSFRFRSSRGLVAST